MAAPTPSLDDTFSQLVADPWESLGGNVDGKEPSHPSVLGHLIRQLRPGQDLTRVLIPAFFLEPRSLLEKMADVLMHPDLALDIPKQPTPYARMKAMARWFISGFHFKTQGVKKPFNPIIGETFACMWKHPDGSYSQYFAEQVSHRPPVTALYFENRKNHVVGNAQIWTKSKFAAPQTAKSILVGGAQFHLTNHGEMYYCTFPTYNCHNLLLGSLRMEVGDTTEIVCPQTKMKCTIEFHQKPTFGGSAKINSLSGTITHDGEELATFAGHWDNVVHITRTGGEKEELFNVAKEPVKAKCVLPLAEQNPWESRRLWREATELLEKRPTVDWDAVDRAKGALEEEQRKLPCHQEEPGPWDTKKFHLRAFDNPLTGEKEEMYVFDHANFAPYKEGEPLNNLVWTSKSLPDVRSPDLPAPGSPHVATGAGAAAGAAAGAGSGTGAGAGAGAGAAPVAAPAAGGSEDAAVADATAAVAAATVTE